tara:strand:- start:2683 stop:3309 length:627 start_codon:yes stop_codon:yes gene_type:complete
MNPLKPDLRKLSNKEIEDKPGRLAAQIIFNKLIKEDFNMWFVGNVEGNQLYTVQLSNQEKAIVAFTDEYIAHNYINRRDIIKQVNKNFGSKVVLVNMTLQKIDEIMQGNMTTTSVSMSTNGVMLTQQLVNSPMETVIVNPNDRDFFIPINVPYIMHLYGEAEEDDSSLLDTEDGNKELSIYKIDKELKRYVLCIEDDIDGKVTGTDGL